jgi:hypothetical protein
VSDALEREVAVFNAARRLPAEELTTYLNAECAGDPGLRQRVEELLQASHDAGGFLQEPAPGAECPAESAPPDAEQRVVGPVFAKQGKFDEAEAHYKQAVAICQRVPERIHPLKCEVAFAALKSALTELGDTMALEKPEAAGQPRAKVNASR